MINHQTAMGFRRDPELNGRKFEGMVLRRGVQFASAVDLLVVSFYYGRTFMVLISEVKILDERTDTTRAQ